MRGDCDKVTKTPNPYKQRISHKQKRAFNRTYWIGVCNWATITPLDREESLPDTSKLQRAYGEEKCFNVSLTHDFFLIQPHNTLLSYIKNPQEFYARRVQHEVNSASANPTEIKITCHTFKGIRCGTLLSSSYCCHSFRLVSSSFLQILLARTCNAVRRPWSVTLFGLNVAAPSAASFANFPAQYSCTRITALGVIAFGSK